MTFSDPMGAFSKLVGGPSKSEILDEVRLEVFKQFETSDTVLSLWELDPKGVIQYLLATNVAQGALISLLINRPEGSFSFLYLLEESVEIVKEEFRRKITGEGGDDGAGND